MNRIRTATACLAGVLAWGCVQAGESPGIRFHDALSGDDLSSLAVHSFSVPRPILILEPVVLGALEDHPGRTVLDHVDGSEFRIRVAGTVYDFVADAVAGGRADIESIEIRSHTGGVSDHVRLEILAGPEVDSIRPHPMSDQLAQRPDMARAIRPYPFVGRFESRVYTLPVSTGSNPVYIVATNINGGEAVATVDIQARVNRETRSYDLTAEVRNHTDIGLYNPVLVYIEDPTITPENVGRAHASLNGTEVGLRFIDGRLQLDRPILGLSRIKDMDIPNLVNVSGEPDHFVLRYKGSLAKFNWSYTASSLPNLDTSDARSEAIPAMKLHDSEIFDIQEVR